MGAVQELETLLIRRGRPVEGWPGRLASLVRRHWTFLTRPDSQLKPIRPRPRMGIVGPSRPSWRVGTVLDADIVSG